MSAAPLPDTASTNLSLRHVMLVGGTLADWNAWGVAEWQALVGELGSYLGSIGVRWLTLRPYGPGLGAIDGVDDVALHQGRPQNDPSDSDQPLPGCTVIVDPSADGRRRFAAAMELLPHDDEVNEATVTSVLYEPADSEPDLVVVLGTSDQLPPSLVWELAYAELYFVDTEWSDLTSAVVEHAVDGFAGRRRRFGGLDGDDDIDDYNDYNDYDDYDDYDDLRSDQYADHDG